MKKVMILWRLDMFGVQQRMPHRRSLHPSGEAAFTGTTGMMYLPPLIGAAILAASMSAQAHETDFPRERTDAANCAELDWSREMITEHPRLIEGCQEVVLGGGLNWARFEALFDRVDSDGTVRFKIRDERKSIVETVAFRPTAGQVAYISNRPVEFGKLANDQLVNLYVPEGKHGFATSVDVPVRWFALTLMLLSSLGMMTFQRDV